MKDACLRAAVRNRFARKHAAEDDVVIVDELPTGRTSGRLDIAVLNGHLHGIELKSDADTLDRLPRQASTFSAAMQEMTLVVGSRHAARSTSIVPDWWTVIEARTVANGNIGFRTLRRGRRNRRPCPTAMGQLLEREELLAVLSRRGLDRGVRTRPLGELLVRLVSSLSPSVIADEVRAELKFRAAWEARNEKTAFGRSLLHLNPRRDGLRDGPAGSCADWPSLPAKDPVSSA